MRKELSKLRYALLVTIAFGLVAFTDAACTPVTTPAANWNQAYGDSEGTNAATYGASDLQASTRSVITLSTSGDPTIGSPVVGPDGSVFVPVYDGARGSASRIVRVQFGTQPTSSVFSSGWLGQISTPAVDSSGNVYFVVNSFGDIAESSNVVELKSNLVKLDPNGQVLWTAQILLPRYQVPPPKLLEYNGKVNIFIPLRVASEIRLGVIDGATGQVNSVAGCTYSADNTGIAAGAVPTNATIPYPEGPAPAVVVDPATTIPYLVMPTTYCGINFYSLHHDPTEVPWPPALTYPVQISFIDRGAPGYFSSPTLSLFSGYALIAEASVSNDATIYAYDFRSGKLIPNWKIQSGRCATPLANMLNTVVYCTDYGGIDLLPISQNNSIFPLGTTLDSPIATGMTVSNIYVRGRDGLFRFDTQMHLQSFAPMVTSNGGGIAIGQDGTVYAASSDGKLYVFRN